MALIQHDGSLIQQEPAVGAVVQDMLSLMMPILEDGEEPVVYHSSRVRWIRGGYRLTMLEDSPTHCSENMPFVMELQRESGVAAHPAHRHRR